MQAIAGFESLVTHHCVTGSMRHIYHFHGNATSEDMLLGLGSGLGFVYWHMKGTPPFIGGRANAGRPQEEGLEKTAGRRTGVKVEEFKTGSAKKAEKALLDMLDTGEPVMIQVDMGYLPYFDFGGEEYHFGGHKVVVAGHDAASRQVVIADREADLHPVSFDDLAKARGSKYKPFEPKHAWYTYDFSAAHPPAAEAVRAAIQEVVTGMLEPPITNLGVKGIRKTAKRMLKWPDELDEKMLRFTCFNSYIFIDAAGGTGGGIFRYMYARFLKEAAAITGESRFADIGEQIRVIGDEWQAVAAILKTGWDIPNPAEILPAVSEKFKAIADHEESAWVALREIVNA